jgi:membrane protease YdiL (CAAX protease family)
LKSPDEKNVNSIGGGIARLIFSLLIFAVCVLIMLCVGPILLRKIGLHGVFVYEFAFLCLSLLGVIISRQKLKEVFAVRMPKVNEIIGTVLLAYASLRLVSLVNMWTGLFFPAYTYNAAIDRLLFLSNGIPYAILVAVLAPAICEEALHRGFILSSTKVIKSTLLRVILAGILFGINHWNLYQLLPMTLMGVCFAYIMIKTNNIIIPIALHIINNSMVLFQASWLMKFPENISNATAITELKGEELTAVIKPAVIETVVFMAVAGLCIFFGRRIMNKNKKGES